MSFGRTVASYFAFRRGGGTGSLAPAWGPRTLTSFSFRLLFDGLASAGGFPPGVPPPVVVDFFSLVFLSSAIGVTESWESLRRSSRRFAPSCHHRRSSAPCPSPPPPSVRPTSPC